MSLNEEQFEIRVLPVVVECHAAAHVFTLDRSTCNLCLISIAVQLFVYIELS